MITYPTEMPIIKTDFTGIRLKPHPIWFAMDLFLQQGLIFGMTLTIVGQIPKLIFLTLTIISFAICQNDFQVFVD